MATKKAGIVEQVKQAITGFLSEDTKRKPPAGTTAKKTVKKTARKAASVVRKAAKKVAAPVKKAAKSVKKAGTKKAVVKKAVAGKTVAKKTDAKKAVARKSATAKKVGTSMDGKLIALSEPYEVRDWCKSLGCTEAQLRAAVSAVGNSAAKVRAYLGDRKG